MSQVVSLAEIAKKMKELGWNVPPSEIADWASKNGVSGPSLIAYLNAALAGPGGFDDQGIASCPVAQASKITAALKTQGAVVV